MFIDSNEITWKCDDVEDKQYFSLDRYNVCMQRMLDEDGITYNNKIEIDNIEYKKVLNGINIVVYNTVTQSIVVYIGLNVDGWYSIVR